MQNTFRCGCTKDPANVRYEGGVPVCRKCRNEYARNRQRQAARALKEMKKLAA